MLAVKHVINSALTYWSFSQTHYSIIFVFGLHPLYSLSLQLFAVSKYTTVPRANTIQQPTCGTQNLHCPKKTTIILPLSFFFFFPTQMSVATKRGVVIG